MECGSGIFLRPMADKFFPTFKHSVEVIWSEDLSTPLVFMVNGSRILPGGYSGVIDYMGAIDNMRLLEDLFVATTLLRAKILSKHCH